METQDRVTLLGFTSFNMYCNQQDREAHISDLKLYFLYQIMLWFAFHDSVCILICFYLYAVSISSDSHQLVKIFPEVLSHQSKQGQKCPTEGIKACVTIIRVSTSFYTHISFWTLAANGEKESMTRHSAAFFSGRSLYL